MKILVIGGSYFLGIQYVFLARDKGEVTVFNRGNRPLGFEGVREITGDRRDMTSLSQLSGEQFDVVVDFCAYEKGDISSVLEVIKGIKQYIFISTVDVYERGLGKPLDEGAPLEQRSLPGEAGAYISGKVVLEQEVREEAARLGLAYTVIRPAFIYGPGNYAPREALYYQWIKSAAQIYHPVDATGEFQLVYVGDVARAVLAATDNAEAYNEAYNLTGDKVLTYDSFVDTLSRCVSVAFTRIELPVESVRSNNLPLPFPLTREESNWYEGTKALALIGQYKNFEDGLKVTINSFEG